MVSKLERSPIKLYVVAAVSALDPIISSKVNAEKKFANLGLLKTKFCSLSSCACVTLNEKFENSG